MDLLATAAVLQMAVVFSVFFNLTSCFNDEKLQNEVLDKAIHHNKSSRHSGLAWSWKKPAQFNTDKHNSAFSNKAWFQQRTSKGNVLHESDGENVGDILDFKDNLNTRGRIFLRVSFTDDDGIYTTSTSKSNKAIEEELHFVSQDTKPNNDKNGFVSETNRLNLPHNSMSSDQSVFIEKDSSSSDVISNKEAGVTTKSLATEAKQEVTFLHSVAMHSRPNRLLGPLHGPDWILDNTKIPRKKPLDTTTGIEGTFLWAVGLFGTVENGAIVVTSVFSKRFKRPLHMLIGTLAITDLFISLVYIPAYTYFLLEGEQPRQTQASTSSSVWNFCTISRMVFIEIASVTLTIKVLISLYLYILSYSKALAEVIFNTKNTIFLIILAWITNFAMLFVPNFLGLNNVDFYPNGVICIPGGVMENDDQSLLAYTILTLSLHIGELFVICVCFAKVHRAIQLGCNIWQQNKAQDKKSDLNYHRAKRITVMFFINFTLCWIPIYVVNIVDPSHKKLPKILHHFAMDLLLLKSAINPAIYMYGVRSLRREMKVVCMCRCNSIGKNDKIGMYRTSMDSMPTSNTTKSADMV